MARYYGRGLSEDGIHKLFHLLYEFHNWWCDSSWKEEEHNEDFTEKYFHDPFMQEDKQVIVERIQSLLQKFKVTPP